MVSLAALLLTAPALATSYYVDTNSAQADDANPGTLASAPCKTIQMAADTMVAGDDVTLAAGTYDETVTMQSSGTADSPITHQAADGATVVIPRDFTVGQDYIIVTGLEIAGASLRLDGSRCKLIGIYVHHAPSCGLYIHGSYNLIRGNRIANNGSEWGDQVSTGWGDGSDVDHCVFEYNDVSDEEGRGEDFMQYMSHHAIIRGNRFHDLGDNGRHNDCYQSGGGEHDIWILGNTFEDLGGVQYYMPGEGDHDHVWRKNAFWGAVSWGLNGAGAGMRVLGNTFGTAGGGYGYGGGGWARNNIYNDWGTQGPYWADDADYNLINPAADGIVDPQPHDLWGIDPAFVDFAGRDFHLQDASPCLDAGTFPTRTTSAGSGVGIPVEDARLFVDGFGIADGDIVQLEGQTETAMVVSADYDANVLTVDRVLTWTAGQGVSTPYLGTAPDLGAFEHGLGCTGASECALAPACHLAEGASCVNGECVYVVAQSGASCDDGDECTVGDQCDASGHCIAGASSCGGSGPGGAGPGGGASVGGSGAGPVGGASAGGTGPSVDDADSDSGCGCRLGGQAGTMSRTGAALALLAGTLARRRRSRARL